jgi:glycosyltransferase involved in cell wall biosynthesis
MVKKIVKKALKPIALLLFPKLKATEVQITSAHTIPTVDLVTTWNARCGIAAYSAFLVAELKKHVRVRIVEVSDDHVFSPYYLILGYETGKSPNLIHVQLAYGMFGSLPLGKNKSLSAFTALLFYIGLALSNNKVITTFHEVMKSIRAGGRVGLIYVKLLNKIICFTSDSIIVHTQESKELLQKNYNVPESKIKIIPMGCFEQPKFLDREDSKRQLNLSGKRVISLLGFASRRKGYDLVVELLPSLDKDIQLLIAGGARDNDDLAYTEELKALALRYNCLNRITFDDSFPMTDTIMNATDIAILPYKIATDSMMLRHLVAYEIPTITSDLPVFREIERSYGCVHLFQEGNKEDLLRQIKSLLYDAKRRDFLKQQCQRMSNETKWSSIAEKHAEAYLETLAAVPEVIYDDRRQKERLDWLRLNISGYSLEIGCATGYVTNYTGADVGLDLNQYRIRFSKKKYPEKDFIVASAEFLPFKNKAFKTVLIPEILEHVPLSLAEKIVAETSRISENLLITLPNADKINYDKAIVENPEHKWYPTGKVVEKIVKNSTIQYTLEKDFILVKGS